MLAVTSIIGTVIQQDGAAEEYIKEYGRSNYELFQKMHLTDMVEILLVEDEPNIADGIIFNLEAESYRVIHCQSAEEALKELPLHNFSLLVLDIMPGQ